MSWYEEKEKAVAGRRQRSESYHPLVKAILGQVLFTEAPIELDRHEATDIIFKVSGRGDVAVRIRQPEYYVRYRFQVTFRSINGHCEKTEIDKVIDGRAYWMFYAFAAQEGQSFLSWTVLDLNAFRAGLFRRKFKPIETNKPNFDGTFFDAYDMRNFANTNPPVIVDTSDPELKKYAVGR